MLIAYTENPAGSTLSYGNRVLNSGSSLRGNLCDSHIYPSLMRDDEGDSYDVRNWAMPFESQID